MRWTPSDFLTVAAAVTFVVTLAVAILRLVRWRQSSLSGLRLLTGNRSQQAALVRALRPVVREFVPHLQRAGLEVSSIALLPTLAGSAGEPLQAQVEQADGTQSFTIRLACSAGGSLRRPEDVAGALADELPEPNRRGRQRCLAGFLSPLTEAGRESHATESVQPVAD